MTTPDPSIEIPLPRLGPTLVSSPREVQPRAHQGDGGQQEQAWDTLSPGLRPVMAPSAQSPLHLSLQVAHTELRISKYSRAAQTLHSGTCGHLDLSLDPPARAHSHDMRAPCRILYPDRAQRDPGQCTDSRSQPQGHLFECDDRGSPLPTGKEPLATAPQTRGGGTPRPTRGEVPTPLNTLHSFIQQIFLSPA